QIETVHAFGDEEPGIFRPTAVFRAAEFANIPGREQQRSGSLWRHLAVEAGSKLLQPGNDASPILDLLIAQRGVVHTGLPFSSAVRLCYTTGACKPDDTPCGPAFVSTRYRRHCRTAPALARPEKDQDRKRRRRQGDARTCSRRLSETAA